MELKISAYEGRIEIKSGSNLKVVIFAKTGQRV